MNEFVWLHYSLARTAWYELDEVERSRYEREFEKQREYALHRGAAFTGRFHIRGQSEYSHVEVWSFSSAEDAFEYWSALVSVGYTRYFEFANQLGMAEGSKEAQEREQ